MQNKKLVLAGIFCALAVCGSFFVIPFFGSKIAPIQHMVNVLSAVLLGPYYAVSVAFISSLLRNILSLGTLMAFPGSIFGAFLSSVLYKKYQKLSFALFGEIFGTSILGGLSAYPIAILFLGKNAGEIAFYFYILPFFFSTFCGAIIGGIIIYGLKARQLLKLN